MQPSISYISRPVNLSLNKKKLGKLFSLTEGYSPSDIYNADERELINDLQKIQLFVI